MKFSLSLGSVQLKKLDFGCKPIPCYAVFCSTSDESELELHQFLTRRPSSSGNQGRVLSIGAPWSAPKGAVRDLQEKRPEKHFSTRPLEVMEHFSEGIGECHKDSVKANLFTSSTTFWLEKGSESLHFTTSGCLKAGSE